MKLFDLPATAPHPNPLTPCDLCGKSWGTLPCPDDWGDDDDSVPHVFLMVLTAGGVTECARCFHTSLAAQGAEWAKRIRWLDALWGYLDSLGVR